MLKDILESAGLKSDSCASLLGIDRDIFNQWLTGQRPIAAFILPQLASVLGVKPELLISQRPSPGTQTADLAPAIWFKLRENQLTEADRENIVLIRRLGFYLNQLQSATDEPAVAWKGLFASINDAIDKQLPPRQQGREAAKMLRQYLGLAHGAGGIGSYVRGHIRRTGIAVIESPVAKSQLEGCTFYVGPPGSEAPCIFANTYKATWFRRNMIVAHELGHAVFDIGNDAVSLDFISHGDKSEFRETRAEAFAQQLLVPMEVLRHVASTQALKWDQLTPANVATLVASTNVEQRAVISAALEAGFVTAEQAAVYRNYDVAGFLKSLTDRALSTKEFFERVGPIIAESWAPKRRQTTLLSRTLRLPVPYIAKVISAVRNEEISPGKAAEMMMMDKRVFWERFGQLIEAEQ